jgi:hypothetical protein
LHKKVADLYKTAIVLHKKVLNLYKTATDLYKKVSDLHKTAADLDKKVFKSAKKVSGSRTLKGWLTERFGRYI